MEGGATSSGYGAVTRPVEKPARKSALPAILAGCLALSMCAAVAFQHVDVPRAGSSALQEAVAYTPVTECSMTQEARSITLPSNTGALPPSPTAI